jgi:hypothetical protein
MNIVMLDRILELTEKKTRFEKLRKIFSNWSYVAWLAIALFTLKIGAEQLAMIFLRHSY